MWFCMLFIVIDIKTRENGKRVVKKTPLWKRRGKKDEEKAEILCKFAPEQGERLSDMVFDRMWRDAHLVGDLLVAEAFEPAFGEYAAGLLR